jgi:hypothetical protein
MRTTMTPGIRITAALLLALVVPQLASAELRRVELKTLGMD